MAHVVQALTPPPPPPPSRRATSDPFGSSPFSPSGGTDSTGTGGSSRRRPRPTDQQPPPAAVRVSVEGPPASSAADHLHQMALMAASALLAPPSLDHEPSPLPPTTFLDDDAGHGMPPLPGERHRSASAELEAMVLDRVSRMVIDEPSQPQPQPQPATTSGSGSSSRPGHRRGSPSPIPSSTASGAAQHSMITTGPSDFSSFVLDQAASAALQPSASRPAYAAHAVEKSSPVPSADYTSPASSAGSLDDMFGLVAGGVGVPAVGDDEGEEEVHPLRRTVGGALQDDPQQLQTTTFGVASTAADTSELIGAHHHHHQRQQQQQPPGQRQRRRPAPRRFRVLSHPTSSATVSQSTNNAPKIRPLRIRREKRSMCMSDQVAGCDDLSTPIACNRGVGGGGGSGNGREQQQYIGESNTNRGSTGSSVLLPRLTPPLRTIHVPSSAGAATATASARNTLRMDGAALNIESTAAGGGGAGAGTGGRKRRMLRKHRRSNASIGGGTGGSATGDNIFGGLLPNLADIFGGGGGGNAAATSTATIAKTQPSLPTGVAGNTLSRTRNGMASSSICCPFPDPFGLLTSKSQQLSPKPTTTGGSTATNKSPHRPTTTTIPRPRPSAPTPREQPSSLSPRTPHHGNDRQGSSVGGGVDQVVANAFDRRLDVLASGIKTKTEGISASRQRQEPPTPSLVPKFRSSPLPFSANITPQPRRAPKYGKQRRSTSGSSGGGAGSASASATSSSRGSAAGNTGRNGRRVRGGARSSTSSAAAFSPAPAQPSSHAPAQPQQPQFGYAAPPPPHPSAIEGKMSFDVHEESDDREDERTGTGTDADNRFAGFASVLPVMPMLSEPKAMDSAAAD